VGYVKIGMNERGSKESGGSKGSKGSKSLRVTELNGLFWEE
jgi:hypothetical protein